MLPKYGELAASTRQRFQSYIPYLEGAGVEVTVSELFSNQYLESYFAAGTKPLLEAARGFRRRARVLLTPGRFNCVMAHFELLPYMPGLFEWYLERRNVPLVLDFDDAIHLQYEGHTNGLVRGLLGDKIPSIVRRASAVIAGNDYIAAFAKSAGCRRVVTLPTVIDPNRYEVKSFNPGRDRPTTIGWMGSRSTARYLDMILPVLNRLIEKHEVRLLVVGAEIEGNWGFPIECRPWSEEREIDDLNEMDIGIMPLPDTPWERGKCGYKLIQYMGVARPVVASPVGVNSKIVEHGLNGLLATSKDEWYEALEGLLEDAPLRARMGRAGRGKVEREYSIDVTAPKLVRLLQEVAAS